MRQRLQVRVTEIKRGVRHGRHPRAEAYAGLEIAQRLQQDIFALAGKAGGRTNARIVVSMTRPAAVLQSKLLAGQRERIGLGGGNEA
jgi:hypothetical protein